MVETKLYRPRATYVPSGRDVYLVNIWYEKKSTAQGYIDEYKREKEYTNLYLDVKTKRQVLKKTPSAKIRYKPKIINR